MNTLFVGHKLIQLDSVDSTNKYAAKILSLPDWVEGTVIVAEEQHSGRGRLDRKWQSEPGKNLTCSILIKPSFVATRNAFLLQMVSSLAVSDTLEKYLDEPIQVKWPNDIFIQQQKICGILTETSLRGSQLISAVVGIGVNLNQIHFPDLSATSVKVVSGHEIDRMDFLLTLCTHFEVRYLELKNNPDKLVRDYQSKLLGLGIPLNYVFQGEQISAVLKKVQTDGTALFITAHGEIACRIDDIKLISF